MERIILRDADGNFLGMEFVETVNERSDRVRHHESQGRKPEAASGEMDGFNFVSRPGS